MKKIGMLGCFLGGLLSVSVAQGVESFWIKKEMQRQWLVGGSIGRADLSGSLQTRFSYRSLPAIPSGQLANGIQDRSFLYGIFVGYEQICPQWLMGWEMNVDWTSMDKNHSFTFTDPSGLFTWRGQAYHERGATPSLSGRVGYALLPYFMPYVRLGVEVSRDKLWTEYATGPGSTPMMMTPEARIWVYRFLTGIGAEMPIYCTALTFRLEVNYHSKGKTIEADAGFNDGVVNPYFNSDLQPKMYSYRLSLVRHFM